MKHGVLLINLGTPDAPSIPAVRRYLREFLTDPRVLVMPKILRTVLVYGLILPFRTRRTTHAYQSIWTTDDSPLRYHSLRLTQALQRRLNDTHQVVLGMRYGYPSIQDALNALRPCTHITILPLYPQYSSSATGTAIQSALSLLAQQTIIPSIRVIRDFYQHPAFIQANVNNLRPWVHEESHVLFSYHGLPTPHLEGITCSTLCQHHCPAPPQADPQAACYRAQCFASSHAIAHALGLPQERYTTSFQSRLGRVEWIKPYTDEVLQELAQRGVQHLVIHCPSFIADCLETLEEIGMRAQEQWQQLGGQSFQLVPCLNDHPAWIEAMVQLIESTT